MRRSAHHHARQRGMALLVAVAMLSLVGLVIGAAMQFAHSDVGRTSRMHEQAQSRLLLLAAARIGDGALPALPVPDCRWQVDSSPSIDPVVIVRCGQTRAWQRMARQGDRWVIVAAGSGEPVAREVPSTP